MEYIYFIITLIINNTPQKITLVCNIHTKLNSYENPILTVPIKDDWRQLSSEFLREFRQVFFSLCNLF